MSPRIASLLPAATELACAVGPGSVRKALMEAGLEAHVIVLRADSLAGLSRDAIEVADAAGRPDAGRALARELEARLAAMPALAAGGAG